MMLGHEGTMAEQAIFRSRFKSPKLNFLSD